MSRKKTGRPLHGWINFDKPEGMSSSAAVGKIKWLTGAAKAGHGGTLDPLATGLLPIALGEATKTVSYVMDGPKTYTFTILWGESRTTEDAEGEVCGTSAVRPDGKAIVAALPSFTGTIEQTPSAYSAIKIDGKRAYQLARDGEKVEMPSRSVDVHAFTLKKIISVDEAAFEVECGKGTYIRSLGRDLALYLGTVGHIRNLRRTRVGPFCEPGAISLDIMETLGHIAPDSEVLHPIETVLDDIPALALTESEAHRLRHGQTIPVLPVVNRASNKTLRQGDALCVLFEGKLVALAEIAGGEIRSLRVINY